MEKKLAPMKPKVPSGYEEGTGGLKPSSWDVRCFVDGDWAGTRPSPSWSFDANWGVGLLGSHSILEVQPDGAISIAPGESMAKLFDEILADNLAAKIHPAQLCSLGPPSLAPTSQICARRC